MAADTLANLQNVVLLAARVLIGAIFLQAGTQKLRHFGEWQGVLGSYRILPAALLSPVSYVLPVAEIAAAGGLWLGQALWIGQQTVAAFGALLMLVCFTAAVGVNLARGRRHIDCGCFQTRLRQTLSGGLLLRNVFLLITTAALVWGSSAMTPAAPVAFVAVPLGGVCFILYAAINELMLQPQLDPT